MTPLLSPADVARLLGVSRQTVYNLVAAGKLPAISFCARAGKEKDRLTIRFRPQDVEAFINGHLRDGRREAAG